MCLRDKIPRAIHVFMFRGDGSSGLDCLSAWERRGDGPGGGSAICFYDASSLRSERGMRY